MYKRFNTKPIMVGNIQIGGQNKVIIQSMTTTKTENINETVSQIKELEVAGCEIIRVACLDQADVDAIKEIKKQINIPLVADIHFNYKYAIDAIANGIDKIRINPGNIGDESRIKEVVIAANEKNIPIRIGVNAGSLEKHILEKYKYPTADGMVESALYHIKLLEKFNFTNIALSLKSSNVAMAIEAYEKISKLVNYPLHIGITESGTLFSGTIKSSIGLGILLNQGIGDTLRVSLSANPVEEIKVAKEILKTFGLVNNMPTLISCPTCGRCRIDLFKVASEIEEYLETVKVDLKVAVMGCAVNGPGEAREADIGIAGGIGEAILFKKGKIVRKIKEDRLILELKEEIEKIISNI